MARTRSIERLALGRLAEDVEAAADLGVLELAQVAVDVQDDVVEGVVRAGARPEVEVAVDLGVTSSVPDLVAEGRQLRRVER